LDKLISVRFAHPLKAQQSITLQSSGKVILRKLVQPRKQESGMAVTPSLITTFVSDVQRSKTPPKEPLRNSTWEGIVISFNAWQAKKAEKPINFNPLGRTIVSRLQQRSNAFALILSTLSAKTTLFKLLQSANAPGCISFTPSGIMISVSPLHPSKAHAPITDIPSGIL
jgi:hypothetical protein